MEDPRTTSVRLVTNPEKMVLRETQRAFVYFSLHGLTVDSIIVNRVLPAEVMDAWFNDWHMTQEHVLREIEEYFAPVPVRRVPLFSHEVLGKQRLHDLAALLYPGSEDPAAVTRTESLTPLENEMACMKFGSICHSLQSEIGLFKKGDELVVEIGTLRRHIGLPRTMVMLSPSRATLENGLLTVEMLEAK